MKKSKGRLFLEKKGNIVPFANEETPYEILSCKEGSVFGNEYTENTAWTGQACADAGRPELGMYYFQHFDDCFQTFNKVRFLGFFSYWDADKYGWFYCDSRGNIDANGDMQSPITFTVGIYEEGEDGMPGKCIMTKDIDIVGERTRVEIGDFTSGYTNIYEFTAELGQDINLEHGYIQFNAKDMGDSPSCWFSVFTVGGQDAVQMDVANEEYSGQLGAAFCLYGNGDFNAKKALQLERFLTPLSSANGKYEKVEVEVTNIGENAISDACLELYVDDKLVSTESINTEIQPFSSYKYTFLTRVDCTSEHKITVKNVTPGDEKKSYETISKTVTPPTIGEYPECVVRVPNVISIVNVKLGDINNTSEGSTYSDFTDKKTTIHTGGETVNLEVSINTQNYEPAFGMFIDWNGDHNFSYDEQVELSEFTATDNSGLAKATISVPETAVAGEHRVRMVAVPYYYNPDPAGSYYYAEVEDYTIVVERAAGSAAATIDKNIVDETVEGGTKTTDITLANNGEGKLTANVALTYYLPDAPKIGDNAANAANRAAARGKFNVKAQKVEKKDAPVKDADTQFVLKYDNDIYDCIGLGNASTAIFAGMYPGAMLSNIAGMTVNSVDVYVGPNVPESASIVIYGEGSQDKTGAVIAEKAFTPTADSWNHIMLDNPVTIGSTDLWVGVKMNGLTANGYYIGVDEGPAKVGFSDLVNIGGNTWWSMSDLGLDYNYCIRANVGGTRTPVINWLSVDKENLEVASGSTDKIGLSFATQGLKKGLYEAAIEITTNDPLLKSTVVPVYMVNGDLSAISEIENGKPGIVLNGNVLTVKSAKAVSGVKVTDISGRSMMSAAVNGNEATVDLTAFGKGVYIVTVAHNDGTKISVKVPVIR